MVALFCLFLPPQKFFQLFLGIKRGPVNALQLRILLVTQPVSSGDAQQLECFDLAGGRDMRAAAEILKLTGAVDGDFLIGRGEVLDEVALHEVAF